MIPDLQQPQIHSAIITGIGTAAAAGLALGGWAYASLWPASRIFGEALIAPKRPLELALTFDDGPNPEWTPPLLDILARSEIQATFFLIGKYAAAQPALVREIQSAGHLIGNHTWTHPNLAVTDPKRTRQELLQTTSQLEQLLGTPVKHFRPPFGGRSPATFKIARDLGLTPVLWNAMTSDWSAASPDTITARLIPSIEKNQRRGQASNIVLHDGSHETPAADRSASVAATGQILNHFRQTHRFVTLDAWKFPI